MRIRHRQPLLETLEELVANAAELLSSTKRRRTFTKIIKNFYVFCSSPLKLSLFENLTLIVANNITVEDWQRDDNIASSAITI